MKLSRQVLMLLALICLTSIPSQLFADEIEIAQLKRTDAVDFDREVLPILRRSCLACHNESDAESELVLESPESILAGGATGEVIVPGDPDKSFLLQVSAHREEPVMPPEENSVEAPNLTPDELGLIRLWILQGAQGSSAAGGVVEFEPLPAGLNPVYALALSKDGQTLAAGRANQVSIYHLPSRRETGRLTDPHLLESGIYSRPGIAHLDLVQSIAISPDGRRIATGGYRTVKLWERTPTEILANTTFAQPQTSSVALTELSVIAIGNAAGQIHLVDGTTGRVIQFWVAHDGPVTALAKLSEQELVSCGQDGRIHQWSFSPDAQLPSLLRGGSVEVGQPIAACCFTDDQSHFIIATADHQLNLWSTSSLTSANDPKGENVASTPIRSWAAHDQSIRLIRVVDGATSTIVTGAEDGQLRLWNYADGKQLAQFDQGGAVSDVIVINEGTQLASSGANQSVKVWDIASGKLLHELQGDAESERHVAMSGFQQRLSQRLFDLAKADLEAGTQRKAAEEENANKSRAAVASGETDLQAKQTAVAESQKAVEAAEAKLAEAKAEVANQEQLLANAQMKIAEANPRRDESNANKQKADQELAASEEAFQKNLNELAQIQVRVTAAPQDQDQLQQLQAMLAKVTAQTAAQLKLVQDQQTFAQSLTSLMGIIAEEETRMTAAQQALKVAQEALPASEKMVADANAARDKANQEMETSTRNLDALKRAVVRAEEAVQIATDAIPGLEGALASAEAALRVAQEQHVKATEELQSSRQPFVAVQYDDERDLLFTLTRTGRLQTWDIETGASIDALTIPMRESENELPAASHLIRLGANRIAAATASQLSVIENGGEWKLIRQIGSPDSDSPFADRVTALDFHPGGELLAIGSGEPSRTGQMFIVDASSGEIVSTINEPHSDTVWSVRFSPDGTRLASGGADRFLKVFDAETGELVRAFEGHTHHVLGVAWSADGRRLASAGADKSVKIWDALTGEQQRTIEGFGKEATAVRFLGLENQVVVSSGDQTVQIKRADNGGNVRSFGGFDDFVHCVDLNQDGQWIVAGGQDSVVRVWSLDGKVFAEFRGDLESLTSASE